MHGQTFIASPLPARSLEHPRLSQIARERSLHHLEKLVQLPRPFVVNGSLRAHVVIARYAVALRSEHLTGHLSRFVAGEENHNRRDVDRIGRGSLRLTAGRNPPRLLVNRIGHPRGRDGKNRVAGDSITAQALSGAESQTQDSCFSRRITGLTRT